jgi:NTE family protein
VPLFAGLDPAARAALAARTTTVALAAGDWLFREGDVADALYIVRSGRLEILQQAGGSAPKLLQELAPGAVLGELALVVDTPRTASARARRDARLLRVGREDFESVLESSPGVSRALLRTLGDWLIRGADEGAARPPVTIAVIALDRGAAAAAVDSALATELGRFGRVHHVTRDAIDDEAAVGHELSELLDRIEPSQGHVVLAGGLLGSPDPWTDACMRQADRVLLAVEVAPARDQRRDWGLPTGADVVLLGQPGAPGIGELLDELSPRATMRVRPGAERDEDIAVIARRLAGRSVGLVLSGGGARCFSQIGVIEELHAAGVRIDRIGGTSMGAFIGALLAQGLDHTEIDARCYEEFVRRNPLTDYRFPRTSLVRGKRARAMLERNLPGAIEDLARGYFCVSVDVIAAETFRHRRGLLADAVGASMSLPIFAPPVVHGNRLLLDGALMDNLPTEAMASEAEGPIIAVDATEPSMRSLPEGTEPTVPTIMETIYKVMLLSESDSDRRQSFADVLIRPDYDGIGILEFHMLDQMRESGRRAAVEALERAPASVFG